MFEKMKTIMKPGIYKILKIFYQNRNQPLPLRALARETGLNESSISRHINSLLKGKVLKSEEDGNRKQFCVNPAFVPQLFPLYDYERLNKLPLLRRNAIYEYLRRSHPKPLLAIVFGSTAKSTFREDSDLDILQIHPLSTDLHNRAKEVEAQTAISLQVLSLTSTQLEEAFRSKDPVVLAAFKTAFPIFNHAYFYEINHERIPT